MTLGLIAALALSQVDRGSRSGLFGYFMPYQLVADGQNGSFMEKDVVIATTTVQWDRMRSKLGIDDDKNKTLTDLHGPLGAMDWTREQVVFARTPEYPTGGYSASLFKLTMEPHGDWKIELAVSAPPPGSAVIQMLTRPYVVFRMRQTEGKPWLIVHSPKPQ